MQVAFDATRDDFLLAMVALSMGEASRGRP
jgi:hypothetical protein